MRIRRKAAVAKPITKQLEMEFRQHGGKRKGAGRKKHRQNCINHVKRSELSGREPIGITLKLISGLPSIRTPMIMVALARAMRLARRFGMSVIHFDVQSNHIHLIVEAASKATLTRGMRSLTTSLARAVHRFIGFGFCGQVLKGRYHAHVLKTPTEVKRALRYVIFNLAKHKSCSAFVDPYSSVFTFEGVGGIVTAAEYERMRGDLKRRPSWYGPIADALANASTFLLAIGWRKSKATVTDAWKA